MDSEKRVYLNVCEVTIENIVPQSTCLAFQTLPKSAQQHFYPILPWSRHRLSWKRFLFVKSKILELFVNTLTGDYNYSRHNRENSLQPIQM